MFNMLLVLNVGYWGGLQWHEFISCFVKINSFKRFQILTGETTYRQHINLIPMLFSSTLWFILKKVSISEYINLKVG